MFEKDDDGDKPHLWYLAAMLLCTVFALAALWIYTSTQGVRFLESGYSVWSAKRTLLRNCDLGDVAVFGDSRADSAVVPARFSTKATNLGFAGGTPIENYFFVKSALACKTKPRMLVLSFNPGAFEIVQPWLWDNAIRYGALGWPELSLVRNEAKRLGDSSYSAIKPQMGIDGLLRDLTYASHFPGIYFNSLVESRLALRAQKNRQKFDEVINTRGYPSYGNGTRAALTATAPDDTPFAPLPLQKSFFEKTVAMLDQAGIDTYFLITPYSEKSSRAQSSQYMAAYVEFLRQMRSRYPHFHLLQEEVPLWPDTMFVDGSHLNENAANIFSQQFDHCIETSRTQTASHANCELGWKKPTSAMSDPIVLNKAVP
jgi:hypothetical protein